MNITCPKNPKHKRFQVTAHVTELWLVDEQGNWVETLDGTQDVVHKPEKGDLFICHDCENESVAKVA